MSQNRDMTVRITDLRIDDRIAPLGIDGVAPRFSWRAETERLGWLQRAYRVTVLSGNQLLWDSGRVEDGASSCVVYGGEPIPPATPCTVSITVWDREGNVWTSQPAPFETGLPTERPFGDALFIACPGDRAPGLPVFRKTVTVKGGLLSARLYTTGLGAYEAYCNGRRVGTLQPDGSYSYEELKPGFTEGSKRRHYLTHDVTGLLVPGANALVAVLSSSWWSDRAAAYGTTDAFLGKLILTYEDGTVEAMDTDLTWRVARRSRILDASIFDGEICDARIEEDWYTADYDDSHWKNAVVCDEFHGIVSPWIGSPITVRHDLTRKAESITLYQGAEGADETRHGRIRVIRKNVGFPFTLQPGETALIDLGQNFAGKEAFTVEGPQGATVTVHHGEILNDNDGEKSRGNDGPEGSVYNANYRSARALTHYILGGNGRENYTPTFTFYGFRYLELTADKPVTFHGIKGLVITSVERETGHLTTSDPDVNQLVSNALWGQYSNYLSIPTDCPQRDERQGWTADTQVYAQAGCYLGFSKSFLNKFTGDLRDSQNEEGAFPSTAPTGAYKGCGFGRTGWADAGVILPHLLYKHYGDPTVITENWDAMQRYVDGFLGKSEGFGPQMAFGDWLAYESNDEEIQTILGVVFYAWDALMMAEMADVIGKPEEATRYRALYETEKRFFIDRYVKEDGSLLRGEQTICLYALYLDLLPDAASIETVKAQLTDNIRRNGDRLQTGFLGTAILLPTLTKIGRADLAYTLLLQHENPSWLYSVDQGATTVWERWNSYTKKDGFGDVSMNSFNHYAYGAVVGWMFETMAGIGCVRETPGFQRIRLAPAPDRRLAVKASYESVYGNIETETVFAGPEWQYTCALPPNTTAEIRLPVAFDRVLTVNSKAPETLTLAEDGIALAKGKGDATVFEALASRFVFRVALP